MILRMLGIVVALGLIYGCVSENDELVVVGEGYYESMLHSKNGEASMIDDDIEDIPNAELTEDDVFVEDLRSDIKAVQPSSTLQPYVHGSNTTSSSSLPRRLPKARKTRDKSGKAFYVTSSILNVRKTPSRRGMVVKKLARGQRVVATSRNGQWVKIGEGLYVLGTHLSGSAPSAMGRPQVEQAKDWK